MVSNNENSNIENEDGLIFPINVHESLRASGGFKPGEKAGVILSLWVFFNVVLAWVVASFLRTITPQYYGWITFALIVILQLTVGVYILMWITDSSGITVESSNDTSFANYFRIYKNSEIILNDSYSVLEYDDGSYGLFLQCRMGYNTDMKSKATWNANREIASLLLNYGMSYNIVYANEQFKSSKDCEALLNQLTRIEYGKLFEAQRDILQNLLDISEQQSNVQCFTVIIYASTQIQKDSLPSLIKKIETTFVTNDTCYRECKFLSGNEMLEFLQYYYGLEVLDMGMLRAVSSRTRGSSDGILKVVKLYNENGRVFSGNTDINEELINAAGLRRMK